MFSERWSWLSRQILIGVPLGLMVVTIILTAAGLSVGAGVAIALALVVGFRSLLSVFTFVISWWFNSRNAEPAPLYLHQMIGILARETVAFIRLFFYYHPFEPLLNNHDPDPRVVPDIQTPVLFVHGLYVNAGFWMEYKHFFRRRGFEALYTLNLDPPFCDIDRYADQLARRIVDVGALSGGKKVTLIAQSMGGLVCRAYLARYGSDRVSRLITLGTPHHGTYMACLLNGPNLKQMRPGSRWLQSLNQCQKSYVFSNHVSVHDNIVVPQDNARFPGAHEFEYRELGHVSMAFSSEMMQRVFDEVASDSQKLDKTRQWAQG